MKASTFVRVLFLVVVLCVGTPFSLQAAITSGYTGAIVQPRWDTDFGSDSFKQSLDKLKATGANSVAFLVPYYQSNLWAVDPGPGWNTPTEASLASGIQYARSIGLNVQLKVHVDSYGGEWRANIDPYDRGIWFANFGTLMTRLGTLAQANGVDSISLGTEMVRLTSTAYNGSNTGHWIALINKVRGVFSGKLTYGANATGNVNDQYINEKEYVGFWQHLDYVSLSPYYNLDYGSNSVESLKNAWDYWNQNDIRPFANRVGKPVVFGEIGYRSVQGAYRAPWDWGMGGAYDEQGQANDYQALLEYWNNYSYMGGVYFWNWSSDPNAGGAGNTDYTPQRKAAEGVMKTHFAGSGQPNPPPNNPPPDFSNPVIDIWWPTRNATVSGVQPWKGLLQNHPIGNYKMYWQVDGDRLNEMFDNQTDWPHKEVLVDVSGWNWRGAGPYSITFFVKDLSGTTVKTTQPIDIFIYR